MTSEISEITLVVKNTYIYLHKTRTLISPGKNTEESGSTVTRGEGCLHC